MNPSTLTCKAAKVMLPQTGFSFEFFAANLASENIILSSGFHNTEFFNLLVRYPKMDNSLMLMKSILVQKSFGTKTTLEHSVKQDS